MAERNDAVALDHVAELVTGEDLRLTRRATHATRVAALRRCVTDPSATRCCRSQSNRQPSPRRSPMCRDLPRVAPTVFDYRATITSVTVARKSAKFSALFTTTINVSSSSSQSVPSAGASWARSCETISLASAAHSTLHHGNKRGPRLTAPQCALPTSPRIRN